MKVGGYSEQDMDYERCGPGVIPAVLAAIYDVGLQSVVFDGKPKTQAKVALMWEVETRDTKGRRFTVFQVLTNSSNEKATMTRVVGALMGRVPTGKECENGFDMDPLIGVTCLVQVEPPHEGKKWPYISNVMPMPKGMTQLVVEADVSGEDPRFVTMLLAKAVEPAFPPPARVAAPPATPPGKPERSKVRTWAPLAAAPLAAGEYPAPKTPEEIDADIPF